VRSSIAALGTVNIIFGLRVCLLFPLDYEFFEAGVHVYLYISRKWHIEAHSKYLVSQTKQEIKSTYISN
jgi:hypothetical protein